MAGTKIGGLRAAKTNKLRYGEDFYARIGQKGGSNGVTGGFASWKVGADGLTGPQRAVVAGAKGGYISSRAKTAPSLQKRRMAYLMHEESQA